MRHLTALLGFILLTASSAWAQTTPGTPPTTGPAATGQTGGLGDYWWVILLVIVVIAAIWYFSRNRNRV